MTLGHNLKVWLRITVLSLCLFMLFFSPIAWGTIQATTTFPSSGGINYGQDVTASLRFKSSYDSPVSFQGPTGAPTALVGSDYPGFSWSDTYHIFQYCGGGAYITTVFDGFPSTINAVYGPKMGPSGSQSKRALYMELRDPSSDIYRNSIEIGMDDGTYTGDSRRLQNMTKIYFSEWVFLPTTFDLNAYYGWCDLTSNREVGGSGGSSDDWTNYVQFRRNGTALYWEAGGIHYAGSGSPTFEWIYSNHNVSVPRGKWFHFEFYVERSQTNGVLRAWADGKVLFNITGRRTTLGNHKQYLNIAKIYTDGNAADGHYPLIRWFDDIEIWDGIPP